MSDATIEEVLIGTRRNALLVGGCLDGLRSLPDGCIQTCVTSPPYFRLRDYGMDGQIGQEETPHEFVAALVAVFNEVRRVLADDGTLFLNLGDSYAATKAPDGLKPKDLIGVPWMVAFALRDAGWWLRSDIVWHKPSTMPESVTDRPTRAHEYVFLLTKREMYFYDADAIKEPSVMKPQNRLTARAEHPKGDTGRSMHLRPEGGTSYNSRNARSVWNVPTDSFGGAHFATMPPELARRCILAGSRRGDVVLDPFAGAGTTALVAVGNGRRAIGCELNPEYARLALDRVAAVDTDVAEPVRVVAPQWGALFDGAAK